MKFTLGQDEVEGDTRGWPGYLFGGRLRMSTAVLVIAFLATWWTYDTYAPVEDEVPANQVVPPGFVPDPQYTWVPRTRVGEPELVEEPTEEVEETEEPAPAPEVTETVDPTNETPTEPPRPRMPWDPPETTEPAPGDGEPQLPDPTPAPEPTTSAPPGPAFPGF